MSSSSVTSSTVAACFRFCGARIANDLVGKLLGLGYDKRSGYPLETGMNIVPDDFKFLNETVKLDHCDAQC